MPSGEEAGEVFLAEIVSSSRVTIPKPVRHKLSLNEGDEVYVKVWRDDRSASKTATKDRFYRK
jgi:AbrB family looped-hinge helix DNA binding protein